MPSGDIDRVCVDHIPACPACGDLSRRDAQLCDTCGAPLTEAAALDRQLLIVAAARRERHPSGAAA